MADDWFGQLHLQAPSGRIYRKFLPSIALTQNEKLSRRHLASMLHQMADDIVSDTLIHKDTENG